MNRLISVVAREAAEVPSGGASPAWERIITSNASIYYNWLAEDAGSYYRFTHAAPVLWVPNNYFGGYTPIDVGTRIRGVCTGGQLEISPQGQTVNKPGGMQLKTRAAFSWFELIKVAGGVWDLSGDLLPV